MGRVYEASQRSLQRRVALKVLHSQISSSPAAVERFLREARAVAKLQHANITSIFAQGEQEGVYYYAMEYVEGRNLHEIIDESRERQAGDTTTVDVDETVVLDRSTPKSAAASASENAPPSPVNGVSASDSGAATVRIGRVRKSPEELFAIVQHVASLADALEYAHSHGVIHRDIKPHNLILTNDGDMKITDFGLARVAEQPGVTMTGELLGSPLYMSPEQILAGPASVDHRTDVYSLGATLYEWLVHQPPYPGETRERVISLIASSEPVLPRVLAPDLPTDLETICLKAIAREPDRRYQTAGDLRDDLRRFLSNRPIKAKRVGVVTRTGKLVGRHQVASIALAAAVVATVLGWALISSLGEAEEAATIAEQATAFASEQQVEIDQLLDVLVQNVLPREIGKPITAAGAAMPMVQDLVRSSQAIVTTPGTVRSDGATLTAASTPLGIAQRALRDYYEALTSDQDIAALTARDDQGALFRLAVDLWDQGQNQDAVTLLNAYLEKRPDNYAALQLRMVLLGLLGRNREMAVDANTLVRLRSADPTTYVWRGLAGLFLNQFDQSLADVRTAAQLDDSSPWGEVVAGLGLTWVGRPADAIGHLDVALSRAPDLVVALLARATAFAASENKTSAVDDITRAIELEPENADALAVRGMLYATIGQFAAAASDFQRAMDLAGRTPEMTLFWGLARAQQRKLEASAQTDQGDAEGTTAEAGPEAETSDVSSRRVQEWFSRYVYPRSPDAATQGSISPSPPP